jgi:hypothetical protein
MRFLFVVALVSVLFLSGCTKDEEACVFIPETSDIKMNVNIEPFQDSLINVESRDELVAFLTRQPIIRDYIFRRSEFPDDSVFINELYNRFNNPHLDTLLQETKQVFGDLSSLRSEFEQAFKNIAHYYPEFNPPKIQTVVSGLLGNDMLVSDTLIIISLDFYLGKEGKYRPKVYDYLMRKYDPNDIVPSCMLIYGISDRFNKTNPSDRTVLADMVAYGKSFYFAKHMLPCVPDSVLIWYTPEEIKGSRKNEDLIWARFIEDQVLFSTSQELKRDYLGERPVTIQVGEKCPGRIGQWVGWRIVNQYSETHGDISLPKIMEFDNAQKLFKESNYKPQRR